MASMTLRLRLDGARLHVQGEIVADEPLRELSLMLNRGLTVTEARCDGEPVACAPGAACDPMFRAESTIWQVRRETPFRRLTLRYEGAVGSWWHCAVSERLIALNWYSVWFPQELPFAQLRDLVLVEGCGDYLMLKGTRDEEADVWRYGGEGYDPFNLLLYRRESMHIVRGAHLRVWFLDDGRRESAERAVRVFEDILDFYTKELFRTPWEGAVDMACDAPVVRDGGAYKRRGLIVTNRPGDHDGELVCVNAHELAHEWCSGADVNTWEDWLNEAGAEWAMLLYALSRGRQDLYEEQMAWHREQAKRAPVMRPVDGSRPVEGVHSVGTVLFEGLYRRFGAEAVAEVLRCMVALKEKTTARLLDALRGAGLTAVAKALEEGLVTRGVKVRNMD